MNEIKMQLLKMILNDDKNEGRASPLNDVMQKPVLVETATKYYSGVLESNIDGFIKLTKAQWVACTGRFSSFVVDPEGDSNSEFEPCPDVLISIGAICTIIELPKIIRKLK